MALYLDKDKDKPNDKEFYALFGSPNLKDWTKLSELPPVNSGECPDLFELAVDGNAKNTRWIFWGGNNNYLVGAFDGKTFTKQSGPHRFEYGNNYYASQTYSDMPAADGRRIQIGWMAGGKYPGMPFNQQMSLPSELFLKTTPEGIRLCRRPVKELDALREPASCSFCGPIKEGEQPLKGVAGDLLDLHAEIALGNAAEVGLKVHGKAITYNVAKKQLTFLGKTAPLEPIDGKIKLQIVVDRSSIEIFGNDGCISMSSCVLPPENDKTVETFARGGTAELKKFDAYPLKSTWK
jgi:sucrose-6-phosphate hydrolase SacC (GH32 family)